MRSPVASISNPLHLLARPLFNPFRLGFRGETERPRGLHRRLFYSTLSASTEPMAAATCRGWPSLQAAQAEGLVARLSSARSNDSADATPQGWNRSAGGANPGNQDVNSVNPEGVNRRLHGHPDRHPLVGGACSSRFRIEAQSPEQVLAPCSLAYNGEFRTRGRAALI
jgi:hypothetical protein